MASKQTFKQKTGLSGFYSLKTDASQQLPSALLKSTYQASFDNDAYSPEKLKDSKPT